MSAVLDGHHLQLSTAPADRLETLVGNTGACLDGQRLQLRATLSDGDEALVRDQRAASDVQTLQRVALGGDVASPASVTCGTSPASSDGSSLRFCRLGAAAVTGSSAADANTRFRDRTPE